MDIRTFISASVPDALACVQGTLGPQASVLALRATGSGPDRQIEITAARDPLATPPPEGRGSSVERQAWDMVTPLMLEAGYGCEDRQQHFGTPSWFEQCDFLPEVARELTATGPEQPDFGKDVADKLTSRLARPCGLLPLPGQSRRIALIGPPGAGKTTAMLKLAAQAVGTPRPDVVLVRLDGGRPGTGTDLLPFSELLRVPILAEHDREVQRGLPEAEGVMLIDTEARIWGPDPGAAVARRVLEALHPDVLCLVLSAAWRAADLSAAWHRYRICHPTHLLFSGLDLTTRYGGILSVAWVSGLPVAGAMISGRLDCSTCEFRPQALVQQMQVLRRSDQEVPSV